MSFLFAVIGLLAPSAHAASLQNLGATNPGVNSMWASICNTLPFCGLGADTLPGFISGRIIMIVQSLITSIAIIMIIYASIQLSTSQLDDGKIEEAKKIIMYALGGIILSLVAGTFLQYLLVTVFPTLFQ